MMATVSELIYKSNAILIKIPSNSFSGLHELILKFVWMNKGPRTTKITSLKICLTIYQNYGNYLGIKIIWYWYRDKLIEQWSRIESLKIIIMHRYWHRYAVLVLWIRLSIQQIALKQLVIHMKNKIKIDFYLIPYRKRRPNWIEVLNVKSKTFKLSEKNIGQ